MQIYPIRNDADLQRALDEIEPYFDNPPAEDDPVWDSVDVMVTLIEEYEKRHFPLIDNATEAKIFSKSRSMRSCFSTRSAVCLKRIGKRGLSA